MKARLLIVDRDARYREWLRHHLDTLCPDGEVRAVDIEDFRRDNEAITRADCDLLILATAFGSSPEDQIGRAHV